MLYSGIGTVIEKSPEMLLREAFEASLTFTTQVTEGTSGTVHEYEPADAGDEETIVIHVVPESVEYSSFTFATLTEDQVISVVEPLRRFAPCSGVKRLREAGTGSVTVTVKFGA